MTALASQGRPFASFGRSPTCLSARCGRVTPPEGGALWGGSFDGGSSVLGACEELDAQDLVSKAASLLQEAEDARRRARMQRLLDACARLEEAEAANRRSRLRGGDSKGVTKGVTSALGTGTSALGSGTSRRLTPKHASGVSALVSSLGALDARLRALRSGVAELHCAARENASDLQWLQGRTTELAAKAESSRRRLTQAAGLEDVCSRLEERLNDEWWAFYGRQEQEPTYSYVV